MKFYLPLLATALAVVVVPSTASADFISSDPILVTATRTAQTADESLASVTVITRQDIERSQAASVSELLTGLAGIDSTVNGGYGKTTSMFMRGTNSDHVHVMNVLCYTYFDRLRTDGINQRFLSVLKGTPIL